MLKRIRTAFRRASATSLLLLTAAFACALAEAQQKNQSLKIEFDPAQTEIHWRLGGLHSTRGTFKLKSGELFFNPASGLAQGEILVDATTGESGNATRDKKMQEEVLESNRYPAIFFHPTRMKGTFEKSEGVQRLTGEGTFNIHGADHPIELPLNVQISGGVVTATTHFTVPYVAWGMKDPSRFLFRVNKQVEIEVTAKGSVQITQ